MSSDFPILGADEADLGEAPRTVLITGASGNLGRKLRAAWAGRYEIIALDRVADPNDPDVVVADLATPDESWLALFDETDAVVHLAANPNEFAMWDELDGPNMDVLFNVVVGAAAAGVERIIFASSNHAMGGYEHEGSGPIAIDLPPRPDGPYGATKLMGERLGKSIAALTGTSVVALRLGWIQAGENRPETLPHEWARRMWLSNDDLVELFTRAVEAELEPGTFVLANGMSNNPGMRWPLDQATEILGYRPKDGA